MNTNDLAVDIFLKAAAYIREYGWQRSGMSTDGQPRCSMGALESAYPKENWDEKLSRMMYRTLYDELNGLSLTQFNYKYNDGEKVAKLYERTAAKLQEAALVNSH
jgi:hypothetical protein